MILQLELNPDPQFQYVAIASRREQPPLTWPTDARIQH
jgi:hypothetical protein